MVLWPLMEYVACMLFMMHGFVASYGICVSLLACMLFMMHGFVAPYEMCVTPRNVLYHTKFWREKIR